jgi:DNA-binding transcriptional LysR family regulator
MSQRLDIDALRALQAIAVHGGVTRAADQLSLSQSAVSHKIKRLEENLGQNLLNRKAGTPLLSEIGGRLKIYADRILAIHDEALASLSQRNVTGNIRLGITEDTTSDGLARILGRFSRLFPDVEVRTHVTQSLTLQREVEDGQIDLAVMQIFASDVRRDDHLLFEDELCWVKALDLNLSQDKPVPFLAYDDNCFYKKWVLDHGSSEGNRFDIVLRCSSNAGITAGVEAGLGVSIINRRHVTAKMEVLEAGFVPPPEIAYIVRKSPSARSNTVSALADEIVDETRILPQPVAA